MTLYPSIAASDGFNTLASLFATLLSHKSASPPATTCFALLTVASFTGVIRFGFSPSFENANSPLSDLVAFLGLPLLGRAYASHTPLSARFNETTITYFIATLMILECCTRSGSDTIRQLFIVIINVVTFVTPTLLFSHRHKSSGGLFSAAGTFLFVFAGVVIGGDRDKLILGVRRMNWFHYCIGSSSLLLSFGLHTVKKNKDNNNNNNNRDSDVANLVV